MTKLKFTLPVILSLALSACASTTHDENNTGLAKSNLICKSEKSTGSHIGRRVCRTPEQVEREERESKQEMRRLQSRPAAQVSN